jgi:hypothetical protein
MGIPMENDEESEGCLKSCAKVEVPSQEELSALQAMRRVKERVRTLRGRLSAVSSGKIAATPSERVALEEEIKKLRSEWDILEEVRKQAAHERMVLLGHEKPSRSL